MIWLWALGGAAGAGLAFAVNGGTASGMRLRNGAMALLAAAIAAGLWLWGIAEAWVGGAAWYAAFLLLQISHRVMAPGRFIALRIMAVVAIIAGIGAWAGGP